VPVHPTPTGHQSSIIGCNTHNQQQVPAVKTIKRTQRRKVNKPACAQDHTGPGLPVPISAQLPTAHAVKIKNSIHRVLMRRGGLSGPVGAICRSSLTPSAGRCRPLPPQPITQGCSAASQESIRTQRSAKHARMWQQSEHKKCSFAAPTLRGPCCQLPPPAPALLCL